MKLKNLRSNVCFEVMDLHDRSYLRDERANWYRVSKPTEQSLMHEWTLSFVHNAALKSELERAFQDQAPALTPELTYKNYRYIRCISIRLITSEIVTRLSSTSSSDKMHGVFDLIKNTIVEIGKTRPGVSIEEIRVIFSDTNGCVSDRKVEIYELF